VVDSFWKANLGKINFLVLSVPRHFDCTLTGEKPWKGVDPVEVFQYSLRWPTWLKVRVKEFRHSPRPDMAQHHTFHGTLYHLLNLVKQI
jgi:hypothetical protein